MTSEFPTFEAQMALSIDDQIKLLCEMDDLHKATIAAHLAKEFVWVAYCGDWNEPFMTAKTFADIPDELDVLRAARERGHAVFAFSIGGHVDDITSSHLPTATYTGAKLLSPALT